MHLAVMHVMGSGGCGRGQVERQHCRVCRVGACCSSWEQGPGSHMEVAPTAAPWADALLWQPLDPRNWRCASPACL